MPLALIPTCRTRWISTSLQDQSRFHNIYRTRAHFIKFRRILISLRDQSRLHNRYRALSRLFIELYVSLSFARSFSTFSNSYGTLSLSLLTAPFIRPHSQRMEWLEQTIFTVQGQSPAPISPSLARKSVSGPIPSSAAHRHDLSSAASMHYNRCRRMAQF